MTEVYRRDVRQAMHDYLPKYYEDIREARAIIDAEADQIIRLNADIDDVLAQFFIDTATWGLAYWELMIGEKNAGKGDVTTLNSLENNGIKFETVEDISWNLLETMYPQDLSRRRENLKAKMRGYGTVNATLIKNVTESYLNGEVAVIELPSTYTITDRFVDQLGVPENVGDIEQALREIIPAHLAVNYEFMYVTYEKLYENYADYSTVAASGKTYDQILVT